MKPTFEDFYKMNLGHLDHAASLPYEVEIRVSSADTSCEGCKELAKRSYTLEEAYRLMPVPNKKCNQPKYGYCRCRYIAIPKRDKDGRLVLKKLT